MTRPFLDKRKVGKTAYEPEINNIKLDNDQKPISDKYSIQASSRSYFRLGKNVEQNFQNPHQTSESSLVRGVDKYLKSHSKQVRPSVKLSEVQPCMINGISMMKQSKQLGC